MQVEGVGVHPLVLHPLLEYLKQIVAQILLHSLINGNRITLQTCAFLRSHILSKLDNILRIFEIDWAFRCPEFKLRIYRPLKIDSTFSHKIFQFMLI